MWHDLYNVNDMLMWAVNSSDSFLSTKTIMKSINSTNNATVHLPLQEVIPAIKSKPKLVFGKSTIGRINKWGEQTKKQLKEAVLPNSLLMYTQSSYFTKSQLVKAWYSVQAAHFSTPIIHHPFQPTPQPVQECSLTLLTAVCCCYHESSRPALKVPHCSECLKKFAQYPYNWNLELRL